MEPPSDRHTTLAVSVAPDRHTLTLHLDCYWPLQELGAIFETTLDADGNGIFNAEEMKLAFKRFQGI